MHGLVHDMDALDSHVGRGAKVRHVADRYQASVQAHTRLTLSATPDVPQGVA
jgi:hypothetical protein